MDTTALSSQFQDLLNQCGINANVSVAELESSIQVNIESDDASLLIGHHGDVLLSIQRLFTIIASKIKGEKVNLLVDVGDYRQRQKQRLEEIAASACERAIAENREVILRSFSAFERRIIHEYISNKYPTLATHSEGEKTDRVMHISAAQ